MRPFPGSLAPPVTAVAAFIASFVPSVPAHAAASDAVREATGATVKVIVLLRDQYQNVPATSSQIAVRRAVIKADQSPLLAEISNLGGSITHAFAAVNAVTAAVPVGGSRPCAPTRL